ncbi:sulfite exporter TauE/SafE family protein [Mesorhizobium sp. IMUNJ 23232]|uniref:sulfite exporter TauE/SafE family protein n=1 Tax=Mesorhizobium sp. IMUNJ 23232 TaxID=3376064 RepID=UPI0037AF8D20
MSAGIIAFSIVCVFLAAIVRGYSGFGFSLLTVTALSLVLPTAQVVPSLFMLEIAASIHLLPGIWKDVHWRSILPLLIGCLIGTPFGVWFLANVPAAPMQVALGIVVLIFTILLWRGFALKTMPGTLASVTTGGASGLLNGAFGTGGPPVILFYFASPAGNIAGRASVIAYFLGTDTMALPMMAQEGLLTWDSVIRALMFLPALLIGVWVGSRGFRGADPAVFRKGVLALLGLLALISAAQGFVAL